MARVVHRRRDGTVVVEVAPEEAVGLEVGARVDVRRADGIAGDACPEPLDGLTGECPAITPADIAAARRGAWAGSSR